MGLGATAAAKFGRFRNGAGRVASQVAQSGSAELHNFFEDVQDLLSKVTDLEDRELAALRTRVQESLDVARGSAQERVRRVQSTASEWRDTVEQQARSAQREIRKRPLTIGLAAAVIGITLGALLARGRAE